MRSARAVARGVTVALAARVLAGCGAGAREAQQPEPSTPVEEATVSYEAPRDESGELDALERDLLIAEQHVDLEIGKKRGLDAQAPEQPRPPAAAEPERAPAPPAPRAQREATIGSPCDTACRALRSMESAVARICTLTHDGHGRCQRARGRLEGSRRRIEDAGCACLAATGRSAALTLTAPEAGKAWARAAAVDER